MTPKDFECEPKGVVGTDVLIPGRIELVIIKLQQQSEGVAVEGEPAEGTSFFRQNILTRS